MIAMVQSRKNRINQPGLCSMAVADLDGSGVTGFASVDQDGNVVINADISNLNTSLCDDDGSSGFKYHIHEFWNHGELSGKYGETQCGSMFTGNRLA